MNRKNRIKRIAEKVVKHNLLKDGYNIMDRIGEEQGLPDLLAGREQHFFLVHVNPAVYPLSPRELNDDERERMKYLARKFKAFPCKAQVKLNADLSVMDLRYVPIR
ncbi:MAG: hypothetical protein ACMUHU_01420 [Thermoplasmatota archaeon]